MILFVASEFSELLHWADNLAAVMQKRGRDDLVEQIETAQKELLTNTFTLAVLGKAKRGKSTLINALLGRKDDQVAPIDKLPTSSTITRFRIGTEKATVIYKDNRTESIQYSRIREFVTEENNPQNRKNVAMLEVEGAFSNLPNQVELVDTPGSGSIHEHHDALLHAFIPQADAVIFILTARMPLDQDELDMLQKIKKADIKKIFFVLNKIDESDQEDIESAIDHNEKLLAQHGINVGNFYRISAKNAFLGMDGSNVPELVGDIGRFLAENKGRILRQRFLSQVNGIIETETRSLEVAIVSASKTGAELDIEIANLQKQRKIFGPKSDHTEKEFKRKWKDAVRTFGNTLNDAETQVSVDVAERVNKTWAIGVGKLVKELPTFFNQKLEETLKPHVETFEITAQKLCQELNTDYPALSFDNVGKPVIKSRDDLTTAKGVIGGGALAAGGVGLVSAGASATASIVATNTAAIVAATAANTAALAAFGEATAAVTATTATTTGFLSIASWALNGVSTFFWGAPIFGGAVATGTTAATIAAPTLATPTLISTPLWVALAGPVGWTLAGVGVLAVPFYWRLSKLKQKDKIDAEVQKQVKEIFKGLREKRIPALNDMGDSLTEGFRNWLEYQIQQLEDTLQHAKAHRPSESELKTLREQNETMNRLIAQGVEWFNAS